jgi:hypothetical protein
MIKASKGRKNNNNKGHSLAMSAIKNGYKVYQLVSKRNKFCSIHNMKFPNLHQNFPKVGPIRYIAHAIISHVYVGPIRWSCQTNIRLAPKLSRGRILVNNSTKLYLLIFTIAAVLRLAPKLSQTLTHIHTHTHIGTCARMGPVRWKWLHLCEAHAASGPIFFPLRPSCQLAPKLSQHFLTHIYYCQWTNAREKGRFDYFLEK